MKPKILIVVVVVLVLLMIVVFGLGVGRGATGQAAGGFDLNNASWATSLRSRLTRSLPLDELVNVRPASCRPSENRIILAPGNSCSATIVGSNDATRQLKLRLLQGDAVRVILEQPRALTVDQLIERQADADAPSAALDIYKDSDLRDSSLFITDCFIAEEVTRAEETPAAKAPPNCLLVLD